MDDENSQIFSFHSRQRRLNMTPLKLVQDKADSPPMGYIWAPGLDSEITGECEVLERATKEAILAGLVGSGRMLQSCAQALWLIHCEAFPKLLRWCVLLMSTAQEAIFASWPHTRQWGLTVADVSSYGCLLGQSFSLPLGSKRWRWWWIAWPKSTARTRLDCPGDSGWLHGDGGTLHCDFFSVDIVLCKLCGTKIMWGSFNCKGD